MSTDWGIGCRTCAPPGTVKTWPSGHKSVERDSKESDKFFTHAFENCRFQNLEELRKLIAARHEVAAAHKALGDQVGFFWLGWSHQTEAIGLGEFMVVHEHHELEPMNEYLQFESEDS